MIHDQIVRQIARLGGELREEPSREGLSSTLRTLLNTKWPDHFYAHHCMDDEKSPLFFAFQFTELSADYVKSEPECGGWWSLGYDDYAQVFYAVPMVCRGMRNPPVYRIDHETQQGLDAPLALLDFLAILESRAMLPQSHFFENDVRFEDERFANLIRCKIHKKEGKINAVDLATLYQLKLGMMAVELTALTRAMEGEPAVEMDEMPPCEITLKDLSHFTRLAVLDLSNNEDLDTIEPLSALRNLRRLSLAGTAVRDLSALRDTALQTLDISRCDMDFSQLLKLEKLRELTVISANLTDPQQAVLAELRARGVNVTQG